MVDFEASEMVINLAREISFLRKEVARLQAVEVDYVELLRRTNTHNAIMSKQVIETILTGFPSVPYSQDRTLG